MTVPPPRRPRFHLAIPVDDLTAATEFYVSLLGCRRGRSAEHWVDLDFHDHQLVLHRVQRTTPERRGTNPVDGDHVPVPHFGLILDRPAWDDLAARLRAAGVRFVIEPRTRFRGRPGEQSTMFLLDPAGNALEFKAFAADDQVFAT